MKLAPARERLGVVDVDPERLGIDAREPGVELPQRGDQSREILGVWRGHEVHVTGVAGVPVGDDREAADHDVVHGVARKHLEDAARVARRVRRLPASSTVVRMEVKELGHLVLYVRDLGRSRRFYREVLGWKEITPEEGLPFPAAAFSSGRTHHELLLIEVGPTAAPIPQGRRIGLYHFGLKVGESDDELREARDRLVEAGTPIVGATDHGVTHSLYIQDPDGNEIELYIDVQPEVWREDPAAVLTAGMRPLRL